MPVQTKTSPSLIPATQTSFGSSLKDAGNQFRYGSGKSSDANLWATLADAMVTAQRQIDLVTNTLQNPLPALDPLLITSPNGTVVASVGTIIDSTDNRSYSGIWSQLLFVGGSGPATAILTSGGNTLVLNGIFNIIETTTPGTQMRAGVQSLSFEATPSGIILLLLDVSSGHGSIELNDSSGITQVLMDAAAGIASTGSIATQGDVTVQGIYRKGASPGLTTTRNMISTVGSSNNGVFGTPGAGQTNGTVVTDILLHPTVFSGGIITT